MTTKLDFAKEMSPLIGQIFNLQSDEEERYDSKTIWNLEAMKDQNDGKTYYLNFRKSVFPKRWEGDKRVVEIHIDRYKLIDQDKRILYQSIWVYEKNCPIGIVIDNLEFTDYTKSTDKAGRYSYYFPLFIPDKAGLCAKARYDKMLMEAELQKRKFEAKKAEKAEKAEKAREAKEAKKWKQIFKHL